MSGHTNFTGFLIKCAKNRLSNRLEIGGKMPTRRPRVTIEPDDLKREPDEVMLLLISKKNDNQTWDMIAEELTNASSRYTQVSPALVRKVALGICKSPKIEAALGLREEMATVPISRVKRKYKRRNGKRTRLNIDCPPELIEQFDAARDGRTRAELLSDLLDLADGKGEVV